MKKFLVAIVALLSSVSSFAQYSSGGFSLDEENLYWGVRFGVTGASLGGDIDMGMKAGLTLAGVVGLRASDSTPVFIESGLYYTERGAKDGKLSVGYNNLEIPIVVKYGIKATDEIAVLPFFGPYFSYAFSGKTKIEEGGAIVSVGTFDEKKWTGLKRANMGFKLGCGAEYNKMYLELGYQFGVTNVCKADELSSHSNALFVNFGVNF
ncbi:MAG: PorT family protein [Prevotella sp.]|nr:PorT family protein [Prevotella sp.]